MRVTLQVMYSMGRCSKSNVLTSYVYAWKLLSCHHYRLLSLLLRSIRYSFLHGVPTDLFQYVRMLRAKDVWCCKSRVNESVPWYYYGIHLYRDSVTVPFAEHFSNTAF